MVRAGIPVERGVRAARLPVLQPGLPGRDLPLVPAASEARLVRQRLPPGSDARVQPVAAQGGVADPVQASPRCNPGSRRPFLLADPSRVVEVILVSKALLSALLLLAAPLAAATPTPDGERLWSRFRGPEASGEGSGDLLPGEGFGLRLEWQREIGSGYSGISGADGRLFTAFTDGEVDVVAALDADSGEELWRYTLGEKYAGHDGSDDGPLSTPVVDRGTVYVVAPHGQVLALDEQTGERRWIYELDGDNSTLPFYGYTTSAVIHGDSVLVATGGEGGAVTALDRYTGEPKWRGGSGTIFYQTPSLLRLAGREVLVVVSNQHLEGLDPETGESLWRLQHTEGNQTEESAHVVPADEGRFLVNFGRGATLYRADADSVEEVWSGRAFANSLAIPVRVGDHFYGFTRGILTCVAVDSGEIVWRSREPGGQGLMRVGDALAIISPEGELVLADASPEGYREVARVAALDSASTHFPSFVGDAFVVRSLDGIASVVPDADLRPRVGPTEVTERLRGRFGEWLASVERLPEGQRQAAVDERFGELERTPLFESDFGGDDRSLVHFVWRGDADDVGLAGDPVANQEVTLERVAGTDLFFHTLQLEPAGQYNYGFSVDFAPPAVDPENPYSTNEGFQISSDLRMPELPPAPHLDEPAADAPRGTLDAFQFRSVALGNTRQIQLWRPADYDADPSRTYPLLVVNHGDNQVRGSLMTRTLDNLVGRSVAPLVAVFVPRVQPAEYGGEQADAYNRFLVDELLPHLRRHYRVESSGHAILGPGSAGVASAYAALSHPGLFSRFAVQSYYHIDPVRERIEAALASDAAKPSRAFVVYSNRDYDLPNGIDADDASKDLISRLREAGIETEVLVTEYSPNWGGWRGQHDDILEAFFPYEAPAASAAE
ncbi:MAG: hypothetical protein DWQ30_15915 [Acidobacteria bacterium]|nr:MAG: hypothetical protein DWQ30_15915 [Acidobacteriota bacterium]